MIKITLAVEGMMCARCEAHMDETVRKALSVEKVVSSHEKKETEIIAAEDVSDEKCGGIGIDDHLVGNLNAVALVTQFLVVGEVQHDGSRSLGCIFGGLSFECLAEHQTIVLGHSLGYAGQFSVGIDNFGVGADGCNALTCLPIAQFGDYKWFFIVGP